MSKPAQAKATQAATAPEMVRIERLAADLRAALDGAGQVIARHDQEAGELRARYLPQLRAAAAAIRPARAALEGAIRAARDLYLVASRKTKSDVLHGIRIGYRQQPGRWKLPSQPELVAAVRERLPELAEQIIEQTETVRVDALTPDQLTLVGGTWIPPTNEVVCTEQQTSIERALAVLAPAVRPEQEEPA